VSEYPTQADALRILKQFRLRLNLQNRFGLPVTLDALADDYVEIQGKGDLIGVVESGCALSPRNGLGYLPPFHRVFVLRVTSQVMHLDVCDFHVIWTRCRGTVAVPRFRLGGCDAIVQKDEVRAGWYVVVVSAHQLSVQIHFHVFALLISQRIRMVGRRQFLTSIHKVLSVPIAM
jgi:hypothetical protein